MFGILRAVAQADSKFVRLDCVCVCVCVCFCKLFIICTYILLYIIYIHTHTHIHTYVYTYIHKYIHTSPRQTASLFVWAVAEILKTQCKVNESD